MSISNLLHPHLFKKILINCALEFGPIVVFLVSFKYLHVYKATLILMVVTIISTVLTYRIQKRLPYLALYVAFLTTIFGYLTLMHREPRFIQVRDTLYDILSAGTLLTGLIFRTSLLKVAFHQVLPQTNRAWRKLTYAWIGYFSVNALLNEYVRHTHSLGEWFGFKGAMVLVTIAFGCATLFYFYEKEELHHKA